MTFRPTLQISRVLNLYVSNPAKFFNHCQRNQPSQQRIQCIRQPVRTFATITKSSKTSTVSCKPKEKSKGPACPKYPVAGCKATRTTCDPQPDISKCKKIDAPYVSFGDVFDAQYEPAPSECVDRSLIDLQPKELKEPQIAVLKPPPPRARPIDPALERKCLERGKDRKEPEWRPFDTKFTNPCPHCTVQPCRPRARQTCDIIYDETPCTKTEAPYGSFTDCCPQFPDLQLTECDMAEIIARKADEEMADKQKAAHQKAAQQKADQQMAHQQMAPQPTASSGSARETTAGQCAPAAASGPKVVAKTSAKKPKKEPEKKFPKPICLSTKEALQAEVPSIRSADVTPAVGKCQDSHKLKDTIVQTHSSCKTGESRSLWQKICAYFCARPNCPAPDDWKKEKLRRKAEKAAAAAGLRLCEADPGKTTTIITVSKDTDLGERCPPKGLAVQSSAAPPTAAQPTASESGKSSEPKSKSSCCTRIKSSTSSSNPSKKKYSTFPGDRRLYSTTYTQTCGRHSINHSNKRMFEHQIKLILENNALNYSKTRPGQRVHQHAADKGAALNAAEEQDDTYVGKIYQIRLKKSRNALAQGGAQEDMYTTCYTCKFVPRSYVVNNAGGSGFGGNKRSSAPKRIKLKRGGDANRSCKMAK